MTSEQQKKYDGKTLYQCPLLDEATNSLSQSDLQAIANANSSVRHCLGVAESSDAWEMHANHQIHSFKEMLDSGDTAFAEPEDVIEDVPMDIRSTLPQFRDSSLTIRPKLDMNVVYVPVQVETDEVEDRVIHYGNLEFTKKKSNGSVSCGLKQERSDTSCSRSEHI